MALEVPFNSVEEGMDPDPAVACDVSRNELEAASTGRMDTKETIRGHAWGLEEARAQAWCLDSRVQEAERWC
jgi:hypothetical protein